MRHDLLLNIQARAVSFFLPGRAAREREERDGHFRNIGAAGRPGIVFAWDADDEFRNDIGCLIDEGIYYRGLSLRRIVREEYDSGQEGEKQSAKAADDDSGNDALFK